MSEHHHQHLNGDDFRSRTSGGSGGSTISYSLMPTHLHHTSCSNTVQANASQISFSRMVTFHLQESTNFSIKYDDSVVLLEFFFPFDDSLL